jgi:hypothetical protein
MQEWDRVPQETDNSEGHKFLVHLVANVPTPLDAQTNVVSCSSIRIGFLVTEEGCFRIMDNHIRLKWMERQCWSLSC